MVAIARSCCRSRVNPVMNSPIVSIVIRHLFDLPVSSIWFFDEQLSSGTNIKAIDRARGVIADKILDFLRIIERRRETF